MTSDLREPPLRAPRERSAAQPLPASPGPTGEAVPNPVWSTCLARPKHPTLVSGDLVWSAGDLATAVQRFAGRLAAAGVHPGDRVALCGPPSPSYAIALHALGWVGATAVPLDPNAPREELARNLAVAGVSRVLLSHGLGAATREVLRELDPEAAFVHQLPLGPAPAERFWPLEEPRLVLFTSGSSGEPTPVELTTGQLVFSAFGSAVRLGHDPGDRWLACLPFHHVGGLSILYRCAFYGTTVVVEPRFHTERVSRLLELGEVSLVSLVPTQLARLLEGRERPFPKTLRAVLLGGDAAPQELLDRCRELEVPVALTWGMTETASQVATRSPGDLTPGVGVGAPLPFARVVSESGLLAVRGPVARGEVRTRDLGSVDAWGRIHVEGRREEFIVSGGETVSLREIERALIQHPDLAEACVLGRPDPRWGERPVALVAPRPDKAPSAEELRDWIRERLGRIKTPEEVRFVEALPRTPLGKLARGEARAAFGLAPRRATAQLQAITKAVPEPPEAPRPDPPLALLHLMAAAELHAPDALRERFDEVRGILHQDLLRLEEGILEVGQDLGGPERPPAGHAAKHLLAQPGKRVRPLCAILAARMGGRSLDEAVHAVALAGELVHAATLLHDDVIDEGDERRGAAASRVVFSNSASVLAGDYLFADSLTRVAEAEPSLLRGLLAVISEMVEAEALQLARRGKLEIDRVAYMRVLRGKTGALFRWVFSAGGRLGGLDEEQCEALGRAGDALGLAFQLTDDVLDLAGDPEVTGKDALADLHQGKLTWPFLVALEADEEGTLKAELEALLESSDPPAERTRAVVERVIAAGGVEATRQRAAEEGARALAELARLPSCWSRWLLEAVVRAVVERSQ